MNKGTIRQWMSGEKLQNIKQYKRLIAIVLVAVILNIILNYISIEQQKELGQAQQEMLDAKYRYLTISAEWAKKTCASNLSDQLQQQGSPIGESSVAPTKLK